MHVVNKEVSEDGVEEALFHCEGEGRTVRRLIWPIVWLHMPLLNRFWPMQYVSIGSQAPFD